MMFDPDLDSIHLERGAHSSREDGVCAMELVAWLAGERHSDHPACTSPALAAYVRALNDSMPGGTRQLLKPYLPRLIGTAGDGLDKRRAFLASDAAVRILAPIALEKVGLSAEAKHLRSLPPVIDVTIAASAAAAARAGASAAATTGYAAAAAAAGYAASAARYAAQARAPRTTTAAAADSGHAAGYAAKAAGSDAAHSVWVVALDLLDRMIDAGDAR